MGKGFCRIVSDILGNRGEGLNQRHPADFSESPTADLSTGGRRDGEVVSPVYKRLDATPNASTTKLPLALVCGAALEIVEI
jgi:hypothetical protein